MNRRVVVVSEDPIFITTVRDVCGTHGVPLVACLGPAASPCFLDQKGICRLVGNSRVALVDSPPDGRFRYHLTEISAGDYAERLQRAHPATVVALVTGAAVEVGPTGEVLTVSDRDAALWLVSRLLDAPPD